MADVERADKVIPRIIEDEMKASYIDYAMSVIIGRALPDVRDGLKPVHRRILFAMNSLGMLHNKPTKKCARIVGECFVKDTLVLTNRGLIPIQNIQRGDSVCTQQGYEKVSELFVMPKRKLLKITLENGNENIATQSQKFKILDENWQFVWKEAKDLRNGDFVVVKSEYPEITEEVDAKGKKLTAGVAYLLGQLVSDGWVENNKRLFFFSTSPGVIEKIQDVLRTEFDYSPRIELKEYEYQTPNGQVLLNQAFQIRINSKAINDYLIESFNLSGFKAKTKKIPQQIFQSPRQVIFSFISGLIDGDGSVHKNRNIIHYGTISPELSKQLLILLHHFDIHGIRYTAKNKENRAVLGKQIQTNETFFNLEFRGENAHKLGSELELYEETKNSRIKHLPNKELKKSNYEILPFTKKVFEELSGQHLGGGWYKDTSGNKFRSGVKHPCGLKIRYSKDLHDKPLRYSQIIEWGIKEKLKRIGSELYGFLEKVAEDKIYFLHVKSIEEHEEDVTYDIQVSNRHEFVANGMLVHNCLGKYHPHGDMAVYDSLVRMVQPFSLRYPLLQGQGNFGSIDADAPAAMRYTESRLAKIGEEMTADIEKATVPFVDNFDGTLKEPTVLPSKIPNLLVNGSSGIAVGMATNIPPHNITEIADAAVTIINNPEIKPEELMKIVQGPDFPTGGIICGSSGVLNYFKTGRGKIVTRAKVKIEERKNKQAIIVTEIPYQVNKATLLEQMVELIKEKKITGISDIRDESDRNGMRVVIELKSGFNSDIVLNQLYKHTNMQTTFGVIMLALVNNQPLVLNLKDTIKYYIVHRRRIVIRRTQFNLKKAMGRAHVLKGLIIALRNVDDVIRKIKASKSVEDAKNVLMKDYDLTEIQSKAILDMKLQRLASLEQEKIKKEHAELIELIKELKAILDDESKILGMIKQELKEIKESYGDARRTKIEDVELDIETKDLIKKEDVVVTCTHTGYIKRIPIETYRQQKRGGRGIIATETKEEDIVRHMFIANTHDYILFFTNKGKVHWKEVYEIPEGSRQSKGKPVVNLFELEKDELVTTMIPISQFKDGMFLFMATKNGVAKKTSLVEYSNPRKGGIKAIVIDEGDELVDVLLTDGQKQIIIATANGMAVKFEEKDVRPIGRAGRGVKGIELKDKDYVVGIDLADDKKTLLTITENGYGKRTLIEDYRLINRGGVGVINIQTSDRNGKVVSVQEVSEEDEIFLISKSGIIIRSPVRDISVIGRNTQGVRLMKLEETDKVVACAKVAVE